jgi:hypothetical protein
MSFGPIMIDVLRPGPDADRILAAVAEALGRDSLPEPGNGGIDGRIQLLSGDRDNELAAVEEVLDRDEANDGWLVVRLPGR